MTFQERISRNTETINSLVPGQSVKVTTHGSKRSMTRKLEVKEVRQIGRHSVLFAYQARYAGKPYEAVRVVVITASVDAIEILKGEQVDR